MLKFIDYNKELVEEVSKLGIDAICGDYFREAHKVERPVLMTASNPMFTFGGGLDAHFLKHFPYLCELKQMKGGGMERIGNIVFAITVDEKYKATPEMIREAIKFAMDNTAENETLCLSGVGTGIGGLSVSDFCEVLEKVRALK